MDHQEPLSPQAPKEEIANLAKGNNALQELIKLLDNLGKVSPRQAPNLADIFEVEE